MDSWERGVHNAGCKNSAVECAARQTFLPPSLDLTMFSKVNVPFVETSHPLLPIQLNRVTSVSRDEWKSSFQGRSIGGGASLSLSLKTHTPFCQCTHADGRHMNTHKTSLCSSFPEGCLKTVLDPGEGNYHCQSFIHPPLCGSYSFLVK